MSAESARTRGYARAKPAKAVIVERVREARSMLRRVELDLGLDRELEATDALDSAEEAVEAARWLLADRVDDIVTKGGKR